MYNKLVNKEAKLALVGLGYVGLPIALEFAKKISVIGILNGQESRTLTKQFRKPARSRVADHFRNLSSVSYTHLDVYKRQD